MAPIRIAMILPGLGRVQRGAESAFLELAIGLKTYEDMDVHLFGSGNSVPDQLTINSIACRPRERFENWPSLPAFRTECYYEEFSFVWNLRRSQLFRPQEFDVVIHCSYPHVNWFVQRAKRENPRLRSIFVTQNGDWACRERHREYRFFQCDRLVAVNPNHHENNRHRFKSVLIPNGVDPEVFRPRNESKAQEDNRWSLLLRQNQKVVLMASALSPSKHVMDGVRAVARIGQAYLLIAGDGTERNEIADLAERLMPGRHQLLGAVPRSQMATLFRHADVFLHMSQNEPFGLVYLEAAASGLPIISHDTSIPRWILGETAVFVDTTKIDHVTDAIRQAIDPVTSEFLGHAARDRVVKDWTWSQQANKYRELIFSLMGTTAEHVSQKNETIDCHHQLQHA